MRLFTYAMAAALLAGAPAPLVAQELYTGDDYFYIDGSLPVDERTRNLVDAYMIHRERLEREEAERREALELHIYQDRAVTSSPHGRY
jgi:hypothetical protein